MWLGKLFNFFKPVFYLENNAYFAELFLMNCYKDQMCNIIPIKVFNMW